MKHPKDDAVDRLAVWEAMQMFWMDTAPDIVLANTAKICAQSKYSIKELRLIYWNEVRPAVSYNMKMSAPEWTGFNTEFLIERILNKHKYGRKLPIMCLHRYSNLWWNKLETEIINK